MQQPTPFLQTSFGKLPPELHILIFRHLDPYTILKTRQVCRRFYHFGAMFYPDGRLNRLPISLWEKVLSYLTPSQFTSLLSFSNTCRGFYHLIKHTNHPKIKASLFMEPFRSVGRLEEVVSHPALEYLRKFIVPQSLKCALCHMGQTCSGTIHGKNPNKWGIYVQMPPSGYPYDENERESYALDNHNHILKSNATSPPVNQVVVNWRGTSSVITRTLLIKSPRGENMAVTIGDIFAGVTQYYNWKMTDEQETLHRSVKNSAFGPTGFFRISWHKALSTMVTIMPLDPWEESKCYKEDDTKLTLGDSLAVSPSRGMKFKLRPRQFWDQENPVFDIISMAQ